MKLSEKSLAEIVEEGFTWEDFGSKAEALQEASEVNANAQEGFDAEEASKAIYLDEKEQGAIVDIDSLHEREFHSLKLTSFARLAYGNGSCDWNDRHEGAIDYNRSYSGIRVLIESMGDICAVYIKDYKFGFIKPFGECLYTLEDLGGDWDDETPIEVRVAMRLEEDIKSGAIDLQAELYDYYHDIPEAAIKILGESLKDLVTVQEAADALGVSTARVKRMLMDGVLDGFKCTGRLKISKAAVDERIRYIAEHGKPTRGKTKKQSNN